MNWYFSDLSMSGTFASFDFFNADCHEWSLIAKLGEFIKVAFEGPR